MARRRASNPLEPTFDPVGDLQVPAPGATKPPPPATQLVPDAPTDTPTGAPLAVPGATAAVPAKKPAKKPAQRSTERPAEPPAAQTRVDLDLGALRIPDHEVPEERRGRFGRFVKGLVFLVVLAAAAFYVHREVLPRLERGSRTSVRVEVVRLVGAAERRRASAFSAAGWVQLPRHHPVYVTPLVEGRLESLLVIEGDAVKAEQVIASLYARDYRSLFEAAEAAVGAAEATHDKMKAGYRRQEVAEAASAVARLEAELQTAREILRHSEELQPAGAISEDEVLRDRVLVRTLEADLAKAGHRLELLEEGFRPEDIALAAAGVEKARAERDLAQQRLEYVEIRSPIDGVVLERLASRGQWVQPKDDALVSLYDPTDLEASVDISQDDLGRIYLGQTVEVMTRAEPNRAYVGTVVLIEPKADLVKNTVPVRVKLDAKAEDLLFPDMVVAARFLPAEAETVVDDETEQAPVLTVPANAVVRSGEETAVFVVVDSVARRRTVTLGETRESRVVVEDGLEAGERVVVSGAPELTDGTSVGIEE